MKRLSLMAGMLALGTLAVSGQRFGQPLERSVVAVNRSGSTIRTNVTGTGGQGNLISWRKLAQDPEGTTYNLYRRTAGSSAWTKMNSTPLTKTNYAPSSLSNNTEYAVTAIINGVESAKSRPFLYKTQPWPNVWFKFDFDDNVIRRDDYRTKFVWPMDLDGNGAYDAVVVDRLYAGAADNDDAENQSDNTATTSHKIQAYRLTGELLWTVDMGPNVNICGGQNDMVVAYDINCDGRCEVMIRASDGTRFWDKQNETWGLYAMGSSDADVDDDGIVDYRTQSKRNRPFYISVIDGATGAEIAASELKYSEVSDGSDSYTRTSRPNYMSDGYSAMDGHFCICYLDGVHPSLVMECLDRDNNKTHHNYVFTWDYDWTNGKPSNWHHSATWSRNDKRPWPAEFHQLRVADVDGDGTDEMIQGGYSINPHTGWFQSPGIGHGDRYILSDIDPDRPGLEVYAIQQSDLLGQLLYDACTAERIKEWYLPSVYDVGRGACMDVDSSRKGYELYSFTDDYIYDCKGEKTAYTRSGCGITTMFEGVWWNGDLLREELSSPGGSGWGTNLMVTQVLNKARLVEFSQESTWGTHAATGTRPAFMGDITGDWREEVILVNQNANGSTGLVGYTTNMPSDYSIYCLQQDPHYRGDCTTRGYYQHPNTGFYLGADMPLPPLPPVFTTDLRWRSGSTVESGFATFDMTQPYTPSGSQGGLDGKSLMFDLSGDNSHPIALNTTLRPSAVFLMTPRGHDYTFTGSGTLAGDMTLTKSMLGMASFNTSLAHTGLTIISEGTLAVNGTVAGPVELRAKGTLSGQATLLGDISFEAALNYEGCRLLPVGKQGVITFKKSLTLPGQVYLEVEAADGQCGHISVEGDLTLQGQNYISVVHNGLQEGSYVLAQCTGKLTADPTQLQARGLGGINYDFAIEGNKLLLVVNGTRAPANDVLWTGNENGLWDYKTPNFSLAGQPTPFVPGDAVLFGSTAANSNLTLSEQMVTTGVVFEGGQYVLSGDGSISGEGGLTVKEGADVTLNVKYSDYTGPTIVDGGRLTVINFADGGQKSSIGASPAAEGNLQLKNGGTLILSKDNMATDHIITLSDTATLNIALASSALSLKGRVRGSGYLVKDGAGQLNFNYAGTNDFAGLIIKRGIVSQGTWNSTFGRVGSPLVMAGGELRQIDVNSTSTVPEMNHSFTIAAGTSNRIVGSSRGRLNGSIHGEGALTIESKYVRFDIGPDFSDFSGTLTAKGSQWRLMSNVTNMAKTRLVLDAGTYIAHFKSGSATAASVTTRIGSLASTTSATDAVLGGESSTYEVGALGDDTQYYGLLKALRIVKTGAGKLTLRTEGSTSPITVQGGTLQLQNTTTTAMTTGQITVQKGATLQGTGMAQNVLVQQGGTLLGGLGIVSGTLRIGGNLTMQKGATLRCKLGNTSGATCINVTGNIVHNSDTLLIIIPAARKVADGDQVRVFASGFASATGSVVVKVEAENGLTYEVDTTQLNTTGIVILRQKTLLGDANGDGQVNVSDVTAIIQHILGFSQTDFDAAAADVNGDSQVNVSDVTAAINIILGK
mgnify:CR=1 FL=1